MWVNSWTQFRPQCKLTHFRAHSSYSAAETACAPKSLLASRSVQLCAHLLLFWAEQSSSWANPCKRGWDNIDEKVTNGNSVLKATTHTHTAPRLLSMRRPDRRRNRSQPVLPYAVFSSSVLHTDPWLAGTLGQAVFPGKNWNIYSIACRYSANFSSHWEERYYQQKPDKRIKDASTLQSLLQVCTHLCCHSCTAGWVHTSARGRAKARTLLGFLRPNAALSARSVFKTGYLMLS